MDLTIERMAEREWSDDALDSLFADGFDPWMMSDANVKPLIGIVRDVFAVLELVVVEGDELVAAGWGVPIAWSGVVDDLPTGYTDALRRCVDAHRAGSPCNTYVIMAMQVHPRWRGRGVAAALIRAMRSDAHDRGWGRVVAPVRPTRKSMYPTITIDRYMRWRRDDGLPFDPWLRTHVRSGAEIIAPAPASQMFTATIDEWASWCSMPFPESGSYVVPGGLSLLEIDVDESIGRYIEPNVWVEYPMEPAQSGPP